MAREESSMRFWIRSGVACGLAFLAAGQAPALEDPATPLKKAQEAARANAVSPEGREWKQRHSFATDRLMIPLVHRCLPERGDDIPTAFPVYLRLSRAGRVGEVLTELDASLGRSMTDAARNLPFPEAPRDDYWIEVNVAAPL
jgi:hypothetical protein